MEHKMAAEDLGALGTMGEMAPLKKKYELFSRLVQI